VLSDLMINNDFLAYSLANPTQLPSAYDFMLADHTRVDVLDTGVIVFTPTTATKDIVLSCAVHGNETAPIEICNQLIKELLTQDIIAK
jgi:succinylglutamate desuccinylase